MLGWFDGRLDGCVISLCVRKRKKEGEDFTCKIWASEEGPTKKITKSRKQNTNLFRGLSTRLHGWPGSRLSVIERDTVLSLILNSGREGRRHSKSVRGRGSEPAQMVACSVDSTVVTLATGLFSMCVCSGVREKKNRQAAIKANPTCSDGWMDGWPDGRDVGYRYIQYVCVRVSERGKADSANKTNPTCSDGCMLGWFDGRNVGYRYIQYVCFRVSERGKANGVIKPTNTNLFWGLHGWLTRWSWRWLQVH